jgi:hypothetical protein
LDGFQSLLAKVGMIFMHCMFNEPSLKISGVALQFAMQNSGNATPEVEMHSRFAIPRSVKSNGI